MPAKSERVSRGYRHGMELHRVAVLHKCSISHWSPAEIVNNKRFYESTELIKDLQLLEVWKKRRFVLEEYVWKTLGVFYTLKSCMWNYVGRGENLTASELVDRLLRGSNQSLTNSIVRFTNFYSAKPILNLLFEDWEFDIYCSLKNQLAASLFPTNDLMMIILDYVM